MLSSMWILAVALAGAPAPGQVEAGRGAAMRELEVRVNGRPVNFPDQRPVVRDGRILLPLRAVLKTLPGMALVWDPAQLTVGGAYLDRSVRLKIGSSFAKVNGRNVEMDVPAQTIAGRTMVPLRFVGEALGAVVTWNETDRRVSVTVPRLNVPGSIAAANSQRRFFRAETPIIFSARTVSIQSQQPVLSDVEMLEALENQLKLGYNQWMANRVAWAQAHSEFIIWSNYQVTFNSMQFFNGSSGLTGGPRGGLILNNPGGWAQWQAALAGFAAVDADIRQRLAQTYAAYLQLFRRLHPGEVPQTLPNML